MKGLLTFTDKAQADYLAEKIAESMRAVLAEDRDIRNRSNIQGYQKVEPFSTPQPYSPPYDR